MTIDKSKEMIDEMTRDICELSKMPPPMIEGLEEWSDTISEYLIKQCWVKLPGDKVVLSRTEWNKYRQDFTSRIHQREVELGLQIKELRNDRDYWREEYRQAHKETVEKIIAFIETLKVKEDGKHQWRDDHNDCIDKIILKLNQKFVNEVDIKE